jgi:hypothetical protein
MWERKKFASLRNWVFVQGKSWCSSCDAYSKSDWGASCKWIHHSFHELQKLWKLLVHTIHKNLTARAARSRARVPIQTNASLPQLGVRSFLRRIQKRQIYTKSSGLVNPKFYEIQYDVLRKCGSVLMLTRNKTQICEGRGFTGRTSYSPPHWFSCVVCFRTSHESSLLSLRMYALRVLPGTNCLLNVYFSPHLCFGCIQVTHGYGDASCLLDTIGLAWPGGSSLFLK